MSFADGLNPGHLIWRSLAGDTLERLGRLRGGRCRAGLALEEGRALERRSLF